MGWNRLNVLIHKGLFSNMPYSRHSVLYKSDRLSACPIHARPLESRCRYCDKSSAFQMSPLPGALLAIMVPLCQAQLWENVNEWR